MINLIVDILQAAAILMVIIDSSVRLSKLEAACKDLGIDVEAYSKLKKQQEQQVKASKKIKKVGKWK